MRKLLLLAIVAMMSLSLMACGGDSQEVGADATDDTTEDTDSSAADDVEVAGYTWEVDGVLVYIDATEANTVDLIAEEPDYFESASCAYDGTDKIYTYNNYVITFYEGDGYDGVQLITLTSDLVTTSEGVYIGASYDDVIAAYGEASSDSTSLLTYQSEGTEIRFVLSDDAVISIEIAKIF